MVRFKLPPREDRKKVAYGLDHADGIFLSITDSKVKEDNPGHFIAFQSNSMGLGKCLPVWELAQKMRENGVPQGHIRQLFGKRIAEGLLTIDQGNDKDKKVDEKVGDEAKKSDESSSTVKSEQKSPTGVCVCCGAEAKKRCARCRTASGQSVFYCSKECQHEDWIGAHKHFCSISIPNKTPEEATHKSVLGMLLPESADAKPRLVEVRCTRVSTKNKEKEGESESNDLWIPDLTEHLGAGNVIRPRFNAGKNHDAQIFLSHLISTTSDSKVHSHFYMFFNPEKGGARRELRDTLMVFFRNWSRMDGSPPNRCVERITGLDLTELPTLWKGPFLVLKVPGRELHSINVPLKDMEIADGTDIAAFFRTFPKKVVVPSPVPVDTDSSSDTGDDQDD